MTAQTTGGMLPGWRVFIIADAGVVFLVPRAQTPDLGFVGCLLLRRVVYSAPSNDPLQAAAPGAIMKRRS
jgi:hypothetical protein